MSQNLNSPLKQQAPQQSLNVLMIAHSHHLGGMERHVVALSKALSAQGHALAFAGPMDGWLGEKMQVLGYPCCHAPLNGMYDLVSWLRIVRFARKLKIHVLHGHSQRGGRYAAWASSWVKAAAVATAHSTTSSKWFKKGTPVIAVSQAVKAFLLSQGLADEDVHVVHLGVKDVVRVTMPSSDEITPKRPLRLGMVSRVEHVKGHDCAIRSVASLKDQLPIELTIVGEDETEWGQGMKKIAQEQGIADKVQFLGQRNDVLELMENFDILLAPSRREALSLSLIEAAACGRAAIAADVGGIPEVVLHEQTGLLFPQEDEPALAQAILELSAPDKRVAYGQAARQYYEQEFTIDSMRKRTEAIYTKAYTYNKIL